MPSLAYIPTKYIFLFVYFLCVWVYRWLFAPPESRRLLLFATGFGAIVFVAVLGFAESGWVRFTVIGLWVAAVVVMLVLQRKNRWGGDAVTLLAAMGIFTVALITVLYGVNLHASSSSQNLLGHVVLWTSILAVVLIVCLTAKSATSRAKLEDSAQQRNTKTEDKCG